MNRKLTSKSPFARIADMLVLAPSEPLLASSYRYTPTSTKRDWSKFDAPAHTRRTARRIRPMNITTVGFRQAG